MRELLYAWGTQPHLALPEPAAENKHIRCLRTGQRHEPQGRGRQQGNMRHVEVHPAEVMGRICQDKERAREEGLRRREAWKLHHGARLEGPLLSCHIGRQPTRRGTAGDVAIRSGWGRRGWDEHAGQELPGDGRLGDGRGRREAEKPHGVGPCVVWGLALGAGVLARFVYTPAWLCTR